MAGGFIGGKIRHFQAEIKAIGSLGLPLRFRLFTFFLIFLLLIMAVVLAVLYTSGTFQAEYAANYDFLVNELSATTERVSQDYSAITVRTIELARKLSIGIERQLMENKVFLEGLQEHPELLTKILDSQVNTLTSFLERTKSSGVLVILDATVNPALADSDYSRAGLHIRNMEPNIVSSSFSNFRFLRGPISVARKINMQLLPQWRMEFQVKDFQGYTKTLETAKGSSLPLSRLYYWCSSKTAAIDPETAMLCLAPLKDSKGVVIGVCGFEVSSMLFKLSYSPAYSVGNNNFYVFARREGDQLLGKGSLLAGNYCPVNIAAAEPLIFETQKDFFRYTRAGSEAYAGLHKDISLYPKDSAYQEQWALALLMPEADLAEIVSGQNQKIALLFSLLVLVSIVLSAFISVRLVRPVKSALEAIKTEKHPGDLKTKIPEIDDLISYLTQQDEEAPDLAGPKGEDYRNTLLAQFETNIKSLSAAERAVFDLYLQGRTAQEIAEALYLSINTIKTHNKRIYEKLNISSRKELMLYIQMLEEEKHLK